MIEELEQLVTEELKDDLSSKSYKEFLEYEHLLLDVLRYMLCAERCYTEIDKARIFANAEIKLQESNIKHTQNCQEQAKKIKYERAAVQRRKKKKGENEILKTSERAEEIIQKSERKIKSEEDNLEKTILNLNQQITRYAASAVYLAEEHEELVIKYAKEKGINLVNCQLGFEDIQIKKLKRLFIDDKVNEQLYERMQKIYHPPEKPRQFAGKPKKRFGFWKYVGITAASVLVILAIYAANKTANKKIQNRPVMVAQYLTEQENPIEVSVLQSGEDYELEFRIKEDYEYLYSRLWVSIDDRISTLKPGDKGKHGHYKEIPKKPVIKISKESRRGLVPVYDGQLRLKDLEGKTEAEEPVPEETILSMLCRDNPVFLKVNRFQQDSDRNTPDMEMILSVKPEYFEKLKDYQILKIKIPEYNVEIEFEPDKIVRRFFYEPKKTPDGINITVTGETDGENVLIYSRELQQK